MECNHILWRSFLDCNGNRAFQEFFYEDTGKNRINSLALVKAEVLGVEIEHGALWGLVRKSAVSMVDGICPDMLIADNLGWPHQYVCLISNSYLS